jgi:hypothetical protein
MASEEVALEGLFVDADGSVIYSDVSSPLVDMTGWTVVLDIRKKDTSGTAKLTSTGVVSGAYSLVAGSNTQIVTFTLTSTDLAASVFPGDDWSGRYSIKRTDVGFKQPLRFGDVTITRVTQA